LLTDALGRFRRQALVLEQLQTARVAQAQSIALDERALADLLIWLANQELAKMSAASRASSASNIWSAEIRQVHLVRLEARVAAAGEYRLTRLGTAHAVRQIGVSPQRARRVAG
jgi:hypothetical protein